jgi:hypothetical protein
MRVSEIAEGVLQAMFLKQMRVVAAIVVAVCVLGGALGMVAKAAWTPATVAAAPASAVPVVAAPDLPTKPEQPVAEANPQLAAAWADLAGDDELKALKAVLVLVGMPKETTLFLKENWFSAN